MADGRCGGCKHWEQTDTDWRLRLDLKLNEGETQENKYDIDGPYQERVRRAEQKFGRCNKITLLDSWEEHDENNLPVAFTRDASDYQADLYTKSEFGCVLQEPVEEVMNDGG